MSTLSTQQLTVKWLLDGQQAKLTKLAGILKDRLDGRIPCPECGSTGPHDFHEFDLDTRLQEYACSGLECGRLFTDEDYLIEKGEELGVNLLPG